MSRIAIFIAFGTRGDVQPIACLAEHLRRGQGCSLRPILITHSAHSTWVAQATSSHLETTFINSSPYRSSSPLTEASDEQDQHTACWEAIKALTEQPVVLLFNLFALEGYHMAEALGVSCIAAAPYQVPYSCPSGFSSRFTAAYGRPLHDLLTEAEGTDLLSWREIRLWMWPLFTERWARFRSCVLALAASPLHCRSTQLPLTQLPPPVPLLYGYSPLIVPRPGFWPSSIHVTSFWLPDPAWLQGQELPQALLSFIQQARATQSAPTAAGSPPPTLTADIAAERISKQGSTSQDMAPALPAGCSGPQLVCVDIASCGHLGLLPDPSRFLSVLSQALLTINKNGVLLSSGWQPLHAAHAALEPRLRSRLLLQPQAVPHHLLLPHCCLLLHPGGSGSVAAALMAGVPQLVFPVHYDQPVWAERLAYLGLAPQPLPAAPLLGQAAGGLLAPSHARPCRALEPTAKRSCLQRGAPDLPLPGSRCGTDAQASAQQVAPSSVAVSLSPPSCSSAVETSTAELLARRMSEALYMRRQCQEMAKELAQTDGLKEAARVIEKMCM